MVGAILAKGFLEEVDADMRKGEPVWRETDDGHGVTLVATDPEAFQPKGLIVRQTRQRWRRGWA